MPDERVRAAVHYSGHVQGVGFRWRTMRVARGFEVAGYVRNLRDGRVELVVEGAPAEVDRFLAAVRAEMARLVRDERREDTPATGSLRGFDIRR